MCAKIDNYPEVCYILIILQSGGICVSDCGGAILLGASEMGETYQAQFEFVPAKRECATVRHRIAEIAARVSLDQQSLSELVLGVSEAFSNAVRHGSCIKGDKILITVNASSDEITVELYYRGDGFHHRLPDCDEICQLENGGLGRYIMYSVIDEVDYNFQLGFTSIRLVKRRNRESSQI